MVDAVETSTNALEVVRRTDTVDAGVTVEYAVSLLAESAGDVRLVERLPPDVDDAAVILDSTDERGDWRRREDGHLEFVGSLGESSQLETSVHVRSDAYPPARLVPSLGTVELTDSEPDPATNGGGSEAMVVDPDEPSNGIEDRSTGAESRIGDVESVDSEPYRPAIGVVVTERNVDGVVRTTMRATERGYDVLVVPDGQPDPESLRAIAQLGATVVDVESDGHDSGSLHTALLTSARCRSRPGIILQSDPIERIDFDESLAAFRSNSDVLVDAVPKSSETTVMVGTPAYNEAATIQEVVEESAQYADEVLVADDGSTDDTAALARDAGATVVEHGRNRGYGSALKTLFEEAARRPVDCLVVLDADHQHDPTDVPRMVDQLRDTDGAIVIGNRFGPDSDTQIPIYRRFGLAVINGLVNLSMGPIGSGADIGDAQSGFRAYDRTAIESLADEDEIGNRMGASLDILYHARHNGFEIAEVFTRMDYDVDNASSHNPVLHGAELVNNVRERVERDHPVIALGLPGFGLTLAGIVLSYSAAAEFSAGASPSLAWSALAALSLLLGFAVLITVFVIHSLKVHAKDLA